MDWNWKYDADGRIMSDEDGKAVTEAFYEMQRPVAERVWAEYERTGSWLSAGMAFGCGPEWAQAIATRYGLTS